MRRNGRLLIASTLVFGALLTPALAEAQVRGQPAPRQQQQQQQRMQQLDQQLQRMDQLRQRIHQLQQDCTRDQQRFQDQDRTRQLEHLRVMTQAHANMADQTQGVLRRLRQMEQDPAYQRDPQMLREMDQLRERLQEMSGQIEQGLQSMERIRQRIHRP